MTSVARRPRRGRIPTASPFDAVEQAVAHMAAGRPVVVVDDADRENEGDLVLAAETATAEQLAFMVRHTSGFVCTALTSEDADRLGLPPMVQVNQDVRQTAYTVTVDVRNAPGTGISAADRAHTIRMLAAPHTTAEDLSRPGHVVPLRARDGGVLRRRGHTEAAVDLARLAGLHPAAALCELVNDDGSMARLPDLRTFCAEHGLMMISIADLVRYRRTHERQVLAVADARLPTAHGTFRAIGYRDLLADSEHMALVLGDIGDGEDMLVRVHSECLTGDVFGSLRCDCGSQLDASLAAVAAEGRGVVLYLRAQEGRGIGLVQKLRAYQLQDAGADTIDAALDLGLPVDVPDYDAGAQILGDLGIGSMRLLTNNPGKHAALAAHGFTGVSRVPMPLVANEENIRYLRTPHHPMGHALPAVDRYDPAARFLAAADKETAVTLHPDRLPVAR